MLACQRYIELNPVHAGMVEHPAEYRWSSCRGNAQVEPDVLLTPHALYLAMGNDAASRNIKGTDHDFFNTVRPCIQTASDPVIHEQARNALEFPQVVAD